MGYFSWKTSDTNKTIWNTHSDKGPTIVYMLDNEGNSYFEPDYEGYGIFGGVDFFRLTAKINGYEVKDLKDNTRSVENRELRSIGISLSSKANAVLPKLVENPDAYFDDLPNSPSCPTQGFFDWEE